MHSLLDLTTKRRPPTMPFGQHRGEPLDQLPNDYLLWLSTLNDLRQPLLGHVLKEMGRRLAEKDRHAATTVEARP